MTKDETQTTPAEPVVPDDDGPEPVRRVTNRDLYEAISAVNRRFDSSDARVDAMVARMDNAVQRMDAYVEAQQKREEEMGQTLTSALQRLTTLENRVRMLEFPWKVLADAVEWGTSNWHFVVALGGVLVGAWISAGFWPL